MAYTAEEERAMIDWGRDVERRHAWLLHLTTFAIGPVTRFFAGTPEDRYVSALDNEPVTHPVVLLDSGHALLAKKEAFVELADEEATIFISTLDKMRDAIHSSVSEAATTLKARATMPELPMALITAALRAHLHSLEASVAASSPPVAGPNG